MLFGGAIEIRVPQGYIDASQLRQIPDNQEVFVNETGDSSLIVELLEIDSNEQTAIFHYNELAEYNDASSSEILESIGDSQTEQSMNLPETSTISTVVGYQTVAKFGQQTLEKDHVVIHLSTIRIPTVNTDILITWNQKFDPNSISVDSMINLKEFGSIVKSMRVNDWSLFG